MKAQLVAGGRRNVPFALFVAFALTLVVTSFALGDGAPPPDPPLRLFPEGSDSLPVDTTGTQTPGGIQAVSTPYLSFFDVVLVVFQVI